VWSSIRIRWKNLQGLGYVAHLNCHAPARMKLPRDISGARLVKALTALGLPRNELIQKLFGR